jgi:hypothetical protein
VGSCPDSICTGETAAGDYFYLLPKGKSDKTRTGVLTVLHDQIELTVTLNSA